MNEVMPALWAGSWGQERLWEGMGGQALLRAKVGGECGAGIRTGKDGRVEQEGLWKGTVCKRWLLFEGLDQASSDLSGTSDVTVEIITNITATGANDNTLWSSSVAEL